MSATALNLQNDCSDVVFLDVPLQCANRGAMQRPGSPNWAATDLQIDSGHLYMVSRLIFQMIAAMSRSWVPTNESILPFLQGEPDT